MSDSDSLIIEVKGDVHRIVMNRPERMNAIDKPQQKRLAATLAEIDHDSATKVIVLSGRGEAFCAGGDITTLSDEDSFKNTEGRVRTGGYSLIQTFLHLEKPIIAEVQGPAVGLGATIALMCDIVVMGETARIGDRHVNVGVVAGDGGTVIWPLLIGPARAKELLMTGRLLTGPEAADMGLVAHCVPDDEVKPKVESLTEELAAMPAYAMRATKVSVNRYLQWMSNLNLDTAFALEHLSMAKPDHADAVKAWMDTKGK